MAKPIRPTNLVVFDDFVAAEAAVAELRDRGFSEEQIGLAVRDSDRHRMTDPAGAQDRAAKADIIEDGKGSLSPSAGAGLGALAGVGVAAVSLTLFGPVLAGGAMAAILANSAAGGAFAGFFSTLIDWGMAEEEAHTFEDELAAGKTIVTVHAGGREREALAILRRHGGVDPRIPTAARR
jgi:hypothetical protein